MTAATLPTTTRPAYPTARILFAGAVAIVAAIAANLLIRAVGMAFIEVPADFQPLATWQPIVMFTTILLVAATAVWWVLTRRARTPERTFNMVAFVALLLSVIPDFMLVLGANPSPMGTATWGAVLLLILMHVVSWLITVAVLPRLSRA